MESTEALETSSGGQDIQNPEANGSEPSTSNGANTIEPREVTFDQFVETCKTELSDEANPPEQIVRQLTTFKEKHVASPVWKNNALKQILSHFDWTIRLEPDFAAKHLLLHDFKEEFKRLDRYLSTLKSKNKKEQANLQTKIKKLQTQIKKDLRKIDRLDQEELSIEDLDKPDSAHLKKEKYERRVTNASRRLFNLQGMNTASIRILDKPFKYSGTQYPVLNDAVSSKYRAIMQKKYQGRGPPRPMNSTPNIRDITDIIKEVSTKNNLAIPNIDELALRIADDLIREVQRRRDLEYQEMMNDYEHDSHLRPETFADLGDEELNKQLSSNEETGLAKIRQIMSTLESTGDADIGGDEPPSDDEEEEEDPMDALEEDEDISEAEESDAEIGAAGEDEDDDDDDPVILEEEAKPQNGDSQVPESTETTETRKRPVETESTPNEQLKKPKIEESQKTEESNGPNVENKSEETEEEMKEVLPPNESKDTKEEKIVDEAPKINEIEPLDDTVKKEISEKECLDVQPENPNPSNAAGLSEEKNEVFSSHPKTRSESEDSIKIVDLEAETRSNDEQSTFNDDMIDDDDVICLD